MSEPWLPLVILAASLILLVFVKRWITYRLQELSYYWVGNPDVALIVYFVVVLPGVVVHELSHWLMATALGVKVRSMKIGPVRKGRSKRLTLGSVQVSKTDPVRTSLIGLAPLLGGSAVILLIGNLVLGTGDLAATLSAQGPGALGPGLSQVLRVPAVSLWLYLIFAVSNAMLPSESDMAAVRPVLIFLGIVAAVVLVVTGVPAIPPEVVQVVNTLAGYLASAFALTLAVDLVFIVILWPLLWLTLRIKDR
jgi:hypothetical protein